MLFKGKKVRGRTFPKPIAAAIPAVILQLPTRPTGCTMGHIGQYLHLPLLGWWCLGGGAVALQPFTSRISFCVCDFSITGRELKEPLKRSPSSSNWKCRPAYCRKKLQCVTQVFPKCSRTPTNSMKIPSNLFIWFNYELRLWFWSWGWQWGWWCWTKQCRETWVTHQLCDAESCSSS